MSLLLTKELKHENKALEIVVRYNPSTNEVEEIKSIWLIAFGKQVPIGNLMMKFFEPAINQIIDETDWREIYRGMGEDSDSEPDLHPVMSEALKPFTQHISGR